ncbi:MAG: hypothetical protein LC640_02470 [Frankia sp.]|nr:hypothetical protein [Frankia sp.]
MTSRLQRLGSAAALLTVAACLGGPAQQASGPGVPVDTPTASGGAVAARPQAVSFVSATTGWVLADGPCGAVRCAVVLRTRDGGRGWQPVTAPGTVVGRAARPKRGVSRVVFASDRDGWAFGPELYATHDGGTSWRRVDIGEVLDLSVSSGVAYAAVAGCAGSTASAGSASSCTPASAVLSTAAGKDDWRALGRLTLPTGAQPVVLAEPGATYVLDTAPLTGQLSVWKGAAWQQQSTPCSDPAGGTFGVALGAWRSTGLVLACAGSRPNGQYANPTHASTDGAGTWRDLADVPASGRPASVAAVDASTYFVALLGDHSGIAVTRNGGRSWAPVLATPTEAADGFRYVAFADATHGVAISGPQTNAVFITTDAGRTWRRQPFAT